MLNLIICDDEKAEIEYLTVLLNEWAQETGLVLRILSFESGESYFFHYEDDSTADILLLDIQMKEMDGIALAKKIRESNSKVQIIFITGFPDFISEGYEVSALHYLMKPVNKEKLFEVLNRALSSLNAMGEKIMLESDSGLVSLFLQEILYAEATGHTVMIKTADTTIRVRLTLSEIKDLLGKGFVLSHRSYLVSLAHIHRITKTDLILDDGRVIPLSRRNYQDVNRAFIDYYKGGRNEWD